jgi:hypothetical protein
MSRQRKSAAPGRGVGRNADACRLRTHEEVDTMTQDRQAGSLPATTDAAKLSQEMASQQAEQDQLDEDARRLWDDAGDPTDRLPEPSHERLMEDVEQRELHP